MTDFGEDRALFFFVLLNTAVFGSAWFVASRRLTASRSQAILDAALLGYAVQYVSIGLPGVTGCLQTAWISATAIACVSIFLAAGWKRRQIPSPPMLEPDRSIVIGVCLFVLTFVLTFAHSQANLPVISNDALTYHFPAAVQWLQQGRIKLFPTWFFNPANTYSPLAGSMFIAWMIAPFQGDVLARFVEVPALICVAVATCRLCRQLGAKPVLAALITGAALLARPIFLPCMMSKDDLFVSFFFITALVAMAPDRTDEPFGPARFGIALGLLLAAKYTALLTIPILLLAIDGPRWRWLGWITAAFVATLLAGPWYLRNWILTGNPIFPIFSLFTTAHSDAFVSLKNAIAVLIDGAYGLPSVVAIPLMIAWFLCCIQSAAALRSNPLKRACAFGVPLGLLLFFFKSPFPEIRFVLPVFLLLFACTASCLCRFRINTALELLAGIALLLLSIATVFGISNASVAANFLLCGLIVAGMGVSACVMARNRPRRWIAIICAIIISLSVYSYINWTAYCRDCRAMLNEDGTGYAVEYPELNRLWRFVDENIPPDATVAYTDLYLVYPLQGPSLQRRLIYAPTKPGVKTIADLGWLGRDLSGERLIPAAIHATIASPDRLTWLKNLKTSGATFLVIGHGGIAGTAPEQKFVEQDPEHFRELFAGKAGDVYAVSSGR